MKLDSGLSQTISDCLTALCEAERGTSERSKRSFRDLATIAINLAFSEGQSSAIKEALLRAEPEREIAA